MNVLVIEDHKKVASLIRKGLLDQGFVVEVCLGDDESYALAISRHHNALVLNIMVPSRGSLSNLRNLREPKAKQQALNDQFRVLSPGDLGGTRRLDLL